MRIVDLAGRAGARDVFIAVEFVRGCVPHGGRLPDGELSQLLDNGDVASQRGLFGQLVTEADPGIESTEPHGHLPRRALAGGEGHGQFIMLIAHQAAFAPWLFPRRILGRAGRSDDYETAFKAVVFGKEHPQPRGRDHLLAVETDRIGRQPAIIAHAHRDFAIGRCQLQRLGAERRGGP